MALPVIRLLTISALLAVALPTAPALAGWRDGYYYYDDGDWGGGYYAPAPGRPQMFDRRDYQPDDGDDQATWGQRRAYGPRYRDESAYGDVPDQDAVPAWRPRPPRRGEAALPDRLDAVPGRPGDALPPRKPAVRPKVASIAAPGKPAVPARVSLPVPRPNLESMDFDSSVPPVQSAAQKPDASQAQR